MSETKEESLSLSEFVETMPKVELHVHVEGTLTPSLWFDLCRRNGISTRFQSIEELQAAYNFNSLDDFLNLYYEGMRGLTTQQDFFDLTWEYLELAKKMNIRHLELMFDPQPHMERGVTFQTVVTGIYKALQRAQEEFGISYKLIMSMVRHLPVANALETLEQSLAYKHMIDAVGLDSTEMGNPPEQYSELFDKARKYGYWCVAHAGEEGGPDYVWGAIHSLKVKRVDHGIRSHEDPKLLEFLSQTQIPLDVCPISNIKLKCFSCLQQHSLPDLMNAGVCVTINSDDPAYFGASLTENYQALHKEMNLSKHQIIELARNSITACMADEDTKKRLRAELEEHIAKYE